jgi:hypothetical protein
MARYGNEPKNKGARSKTGPKSRLAAQFSGDDSSEDTITWSAANPSSVVALTCLVSKLGGAVTFGGSRDGGALQVAIFLDGDKVTRWIGAGAAVDEELAEIYERLEALE